VADNVVLNPGVGGATVATDDIGGFQHQRVKLVLGSDGISDGDVASANPIPAKERRASAAAPTNVAASATSVTLLASNTSRLAASIFNDSTSALYVKLGVTASATSFTVKVLAGGYFELPHPCYTGVIDGVWDSATGTARVTEST
jgi:hypothetical protein